MVDMGFLRQSFMFAAANITKVLINVFQSRCSAVLFQMGGEMGLSTKYHAEEAFSTAWQPQSTADLKWMKK